MKLFTTEIVDQYVRLNFKRFNDWLQTNNLLTSKFKFFTIVFSGAVTNYKHPHKLGFTPKDIIQTSLTGSGAITFNYSNFDDNFLDITTTNACTVRFFAGTYKNEGNN